MANISLQQAAALLRSHGRIRILTHQSPDGDTLGSAGALCLGLRALGKQAQFVCADPIPAKYDAMLGSIAPQAFEPDLIVAVDVADAALLGDGLAEYAQCTDLCLDHHGSNTGWARATVVDAAAAAACEVIAALLGLLGAARTPAIANCLYTGLCTDTGCFRYSNTTPRTLRLAAELMEDGANAAEINLQMFEIKSQGRLRLERAALEHLTYAFGGQAALLVLTRHTLDEVGARDEDLEGLASLPRNIEGVRVGFTLKERTPGEFRISVRSDASVNASALCRTLGGGGHPCAAGCKLAGSADEVTARLLAAAAPFLTAEGSDRA